jgi:tetratricopeptide (TPR) repeat protein
LETLFLDYRDPLFGVVIFLFIILIVLITTYWLGVFRDKGEKKEIDTFIKRFEISSNENYREIFKNSNLTTDNITLLASSYDKLGEYDKSINLLLFILEKEKQKKKKQYILYSLGKIYLKAGFLEKAKMSFLNSLKLSPRDKDSLKYLNIIYEKELNFNALFDVLESREELEVDVEDELLYAKAYEIKYNKTYTLEEKNRKFKPFLNKSSSVDRLYVEFLKANGFFSFPLVHELSMELFLDIIFLEDYNFFSSKSDNLIYNQIAFIKGFSKESVDEVGIFELDLLSKLKSISYLDATLEFIYFCENCKNSFPISFTRCSKCHSLNTLNLQYKIVKD